MSMVVLGNYNIFGEINIIKQNRQIYPIEIKLMLEIHLRELLSQTIEILIPNELESAIPMHRKIALQCSGKYHSNASGYALSCIAKTIPCIRNHSSNALGVYYNASLKNGAPNH